MVFHVALESLTGAACRITPPILSVLCNRKELYGYFGKEGGK